MCHWSTQDWLIIDSEVALPKNSKEKKTAKKKEEKAKQKEQIHRWARGMKLSNFVLNKEGDDVETLDTKKCSDLSAEVSKIFMKANNIQLAQIFRNESDLD